MLVEMGFARSTVVLSFGVVTSLVLILSCVGDNPVAENGQGTVGEPCFPNGSCNAGLACEDGLCRPNAAEGGNPDGGNPAVDGSSSTDSSTPTQDSSASDAADASDGADGGGVKNYQATLTAIAPETGTGTALLTYDPGTKKLCGVVTYNGLASTPVSSHAHRELLATTFLTFNPQPAFSRFSVNLTATGTQLTQLEEKGSYIDVHSQSTVLIQGVIEPDPAGKPQQCL